MNTFQQQKNIQYQCDIWSSKRKGALAYTVPLYKKTPPSVFTHPSKYSSYEKYFSAEKHFESEMDYVENRITTQDHSFIALNAAAFGVGFLATAFGSSYDPYKDWTSRIIKDPEELKNLQKPTLSSGEVPHALERLEYFVNKTNGELPIYLYDILGPVSVASMVMDDAEMLADLISVAFNDALKQVKFEAESGMKGLTGGLF